MLIVREALEYATDNGSCVKLIAKKAVLQTMGMRPILS